MSIWREMKMAADNKNDLLLRTVVDRLDKIDQIAEKVIEIHVEQVKQSIHIEQNTKDLAEHIRRTALLEEMVKDQTNNFTEHTRMDDKRLGNIELSLARRHMTVYEFFKKSGVIATALTGIGTLFYGVFYIMSKLF
jgi:hypothetical protein